MTFRLKNIGYLLFSLVILSGCEPEIKPRTSGKPFDSGDAKVTRFVAVGGNYLSGFTDNELFQSGQQASVAKILGTQLKRVGAVNFLQPLMVDELGFGNRVKIAKVIDCKGNEDISKVPYGGSPDARNKSKIGSSGPFFNLSVPGARVVDLNANSFASTNDYFSRFASRNTASIMDDAMLVDPTFFMLWTGDRDVLGYAQQGAVQGLNQANITGASSFRNALQTTVTKLKARGAKGVIANIPSIESLPYFTTIPYNSIELTQEEADQLNIIYLTYSNIRFKAGKNPFVIREAFTTRFITEDEYVCLSLDVDSVKCGGYGSITPLGDADVLTKTEIQEINTATSQFNSIIGEVASGSGLALFDANSLFKTIRLRGINFDGITYTNEYVTGGFISVDGIHPTQRGNAIIANEIIKLMNDFFDAKIPLCDITIYPTVALP